MKQSALLATVFSALLLMGSSGNQSTFRADFPLAVTPADTTDILAAVLALQKAMPAPPAEFRPGHVTPRQIDDYLETSEEGFSIQLPRGSLTPSPTVFRDLLLVSGGFGSKEFYAFDAATGKVRWALDLDDDGPSSAVVEDDVAVFNTESCTIFACDALTGEMLWSHYLGDPLMSTPSIADGMVFTAYPAGGRGGNQYLNAPSSIYDNQIQQPVPVLPSQPEPGTGSAENKDGIDIQATHVLIALELRTGRIAWQKWIDGDIMSAPVVDGEELYVTTFPGTLYKFSAKSGDILAARALQATSAPVIAGGEVFTSRRADDGKGKVKETLSVQERALRGAVRGTYIRPAPYLDEAVQSKSALKQAAVAYDAGNGFAGGAPVQAGAAKASLNIGQSNVSSLQSFQGSRILHRAARNYATMGDEVVCTDAGSGKVLWKQSLAGNLHQSGGFLGTPPLEVDGRIIVATVEGALHVFDADSGKEQQRYDIGGEVRFQPVVQDGRIYLSTVGGKVVCIDTGNPDLTGWPTWGRNAAHTN